MTDFKQLTEEEWRARLTDEQYYILRQKGTERPHTGLYNIFDKVGVYNCAGCGTPLFLSEQKFNSHCGWPSFDASIADHVEEHLDLTHGMVRTEITCRSCGGHLGHVFPDGPTQTGIRYCVNSLSVDFDETNS